MTKRRAAAIGFVVFVGLAIAIVGVNRLTKRHEQVDRASLRLQWIHQAQFAGFYVAKEKGFYTEQRIDLTINPGGFNFNVPILVAEEREDFGIWVGDRVLEGFEKHRMPIRAIGTVFNRSLACFMVRADSSIFTPADFRGKTVGVYPGLDTENIYVTLLDQFKVPRSDVREYPAAYNITPFLEGKVDVWPSYAINEPLSARENNVEVRVLTPDSFGIRYYSDTLIVNEKTLREKRDLVRRFLEASEKGWRYALSHPDEAVEIVLKYDPSLNREHERNMLLALAPYVNNTDPLFGMDPAVWKSMAEILKTQGSIQDTGSINSLCDFEIAQEAHRAHEK